MEIKNRIPEEFVYYAPASGSGPVGLQYESQPAVPTVGATRVSAEPQLRYVGASQETKAMGDWCKSGPWAEKKVFVDAPASANYQTYGKVPAQTWTGMAKEWVEGLIPEKQERQEANIVGPLQEKFVIDAPPQPVYERVVYVQAPPPSVSETQPQVIHVATPRPILIPIESELVCRGHPQDRSELCFGCTIPPRQLKFDIVREEASGCFGLCRTQRFKAVCRKCRAVMPPCPQCGKQSVIRHA